MEIKSVAQYKQLSKIETIEEVEQVISYLQNNDWTKSELVYLKHKDGKAYITLYKEGESIEIKCKDLKKFSFEMDMEDLEIRRLSIKIKEEGIQLKVGMMKIIAGKVKLVLSSL